MTAVTAPPSLLDTVVADGRRRFRRGVLLTALGIAAVLAAFLYTGGLSPERYRGTLTTILTLIGDSLPPDFSRWRGWGWPLLETMAMSVAGTALGAVAGLVLGALAARTVVPGWVAGPVRLLLNTARSIPGLVWGVLFVAAVGFGPLPGVFALAGHSTGVLGKLYAEIIEHVDPAPGRALLSHGVSRLGVLRFSLWPQILPRVVDVTLYRWEHNVRSATTLGVVGAGGLGLEVVTAFHLFEYREAFALILVILALVTAINVAGARLRARFLGDGAGA
ncbi:phosphonate ABC transporter, permease protein PhnE [Azospirillum sp. TSO22-1]|uniref:phosphonate ABC transporter, permease protein PhnE n=1 Tax=Azospirillum sp. TSO22-1 TaxID=716789 RepID=UPI000D654450|nr:phosphonate ABC transporter, permease protein PhnE [Azospirillum sp. TSO22-1]